MLSNKEKKKLKALANSCNHKYQIGKDKVDIDVITLLNNALKAHELIKVYFNKSVIKEIDNLTKTIIKKTESNLVTIIGHCIVLYKENTEKKGHITL